MLRGIRRRKLLRKKLNINIPGVPANAPPSLQERTIPPVPAKPDQGGPKADGGFPVAEGVGAPAFCGGLP